MTFSFIPDRFCPVVKRMKASVILETMIKENATRHNVALYASTGDNKYKMESPTFCPALFTNDYAHKNYFHSTQFLAYDLDNVQNIDVVKWVYMADEHTFAVFKSFSGNGLWVLYKLKYAVKNEAHYKQLFNYYAPSGVDRQAKDVRRLITIPSDP